MADILFHDRPVHAERWAAAAGHNAPLVMLHAGGAAGAQWRKVAEALQDRHAVVAPDLLGFGRTPPWPGPGTLTHDLQADLVATLLRADEGSPHHLVGHSYGGATALRLALREPALVRSLVLIEPVVPTLLRDAGDPLFAEWHAVAEGFLAHARAGRAAEAWALFLDYRNGAGTWAGMEEKARARFLGQTAPAVEAFVSNLENPTTLAECRRLALPTTIVCGGETTAPDRRVAEVLRDAIPGCRYVTLPGAGHM